MKYLLIVFFAIITISNQLGAQYRIEGEVYDHNTQQPVPGAHIRVLADSSVGGVANLDGFFAFTLDTKEDSVRLEASFMGMETSS